MIQVEHTEITGCERHQNIRTFNAAAYINTVAIKQRKLKINFKLFRS